jgi:predicted membrane channel-forming protein YqfA (hemolysin III family)
VASKSTLAFIRSYLVVRKEEAPMKLLLFIFLGILAVFVLFIIYACCSISSKADRANGEDEEEI